MAVSAHQRLVNSCLLPVGHQNLKLEVRLPAPPVSSHRHHRWWNFSFGFSYSRYAGTVNNSLSPVASDVFADHLLFPYPRSLKSRVLLPTSDLIVVSQCGI